MAKSAMAGAAGPREGCGIVRHAGSDGIEIDIAVAVQHIAFAVDQACLVAALPQCSGTPMTDIELADVAASEFLHQASNRADVGRRDQQMNVIVHQHISVQSAACIQQRFAQQGDIALSIVLVEKAGQAVVAALDDVLRNAGQVESWLSGHAPRIASGAFRR